MVNVREYNPNSPGSRGSSTRAILTPTFHIEISLREMRESFVEAPPGQIKERKLHVQGLGQTGQDLNTGDIIGGGDLHVGVGDEMEPSARLCGRNEVAQAARSREPAPYKSMSRRARQTKDIHPTLAS